MKSSSSSSQSANAAAVVKVLSILTENGFRPKKMDNGLLLIEGKTYHVTTNTSKNSCTERHFFSMRQIKDLEENSSVDSIIIYHDSSDSCVMFPDKEHFFAECKTKDGKPHFKKFTRTETDSDGLETQYNTFVPYYLTDYKRLCERFVYLTHKDRASRMENWMLSGRRQYKKNYRRKYTAQ